MLFADELPCTSLALVVMRKQICMSFLMHASMLVAGGTEARIIPWSSTKAGEEALEKGVQQLSALSG